MISLLKHYCDYKAFIMQFSFSQQAGAKKKQYSSLPCACCKAFFAFCTCAVGHSVLPPQGILCAGVSATRYSSTEPSLPALQCMLIRSFMVCCSAATRYSAPLRQINLHRIRKGFYAAITSYSVLEPQVILRQGILHYCCKVFFACDVRHSWLIF